MPSSRPPAVRPTEHPCDGVWIDVTPFASAPVRVQRTAESRAERDGAAGWIVPARAFTDALGSALDGLPMRVDLDAASGRGGGPKEVARVLDLGADLIGVPVELSTLEDSKGRAAVERIAERAGAEEVDLVLLPRYGGVDLAERIVQLTRETSGILAVSIERHDEEVLDVYAGVDELGVFGPGLDFASCFRRGAGAVDRFLGELSPAAAVHLLDLCGRKVGAALDLERRLQRFVETDLDRALRRIGGSDEARGRLLVALGGWCRSLDPPDLGEAGTDLRTLREGLVAACPELGPFLG